MSEMRKPGRPHKPAGKKQKPVPVYLSEDDRGNISRFLEQHPKFAAMSLSAFLRESLFEMMAREEAVQKREKIRNNSVQIVRIPTKN